MVDTEDIDGLDPYDLMAAEGARINAHFAALDDAAAEWQRPSRCEGWTLPNASIVR